MTGGHPAQHSDDAASPATGTTTDAAAPTLRSRAWPTIALTLFCLLAGIPTTIALTPAQPVEAFGQHLTVGARPPQPALSGAARLVQVGNTELDVDRLTVWGPLRPQLTMGPVQRSEAAAAVFDAERAPQAGREAVESVVTGFLDWYLLAGAGLLVFTLAAAAGATALRTLLVLRRQSRTTGAHAPLHDIWSYCVRAARRMTLVALVAAVLAWLGSGALAYAGSVRGLSNVSSLSQLVGANHLSPAPVGPPVTGFDGAVIGDSRVVRLGGPPLPDAPPDAAACERSTDSLAVEIGNLSGTRVLNLACPDATVTSGLRGPQQRRDRVLPPQVGLLKQVRDLDFVVVAIGPNDLGWSDFLQYCYGVPDCSDQLTQGEFDYRLAAFDRVYGDLLVDLNGLPDGPQVIIMTSYGAFEPDTDADCPDIHRDGYPGLDPTKIELLTARNDRLNEVLRTGAEKYGFTVVDPPLRLLCGHRSDGLGPDIQGLADPAPFHPTGIGELRMASAVVRQIGPQPGG
ncbi:GDSL-type esterase/lipase family protein [Pseudonocardia lacus]|uniref:GDSL-type esterase/lipase family protein n=1 Tax=Pseudonocardia lacus TaxID=2835865 RepID=UPI001BDD5404|nr:GDSL-type esterase/lipase family protein [Pseudonocardia lacus]